MRSPPSMAGPAGPGPPSRPPAAAGERLKGNREGPRGGNPSPPPSPPPTRGQPEADHGDSGPAPPSPGPEGDPPPPPPPLEGPGHPGRGATAAASSAVRPVPPVSRQPTPAVPVAGRQPCPGAQGRPVGSHGTAALGCEPMQCGRRGIHEATRLRARPGRAEKQTAARRPSRPPPREAPRANPRRGGAPTTPPATLTQRRAARPRPAPGAAQRPRPNKYTSGGCTGNEGGSEPGVTSQEVGNHGATLPPLSPHSPSPVRGMPETGHEGAAPPPPQVRGEVPPPPERAAAPGKGMLLSPYATRPHAPTRLLPRGARQASEPAPAHNGATRTTPGDNTRTQTGAVWGPRAPRSERRQ